MITRGQFDSQRDHQARDVAAAVDGVASGELGERLDRGKLLVEDRPDVGVPRLIDPVERGEHERVLVAELVVEGAARVTGLGGDVRQDEVGVARPRDPRAVASSNAARERARRSAWVGRSRVAIDVLAAAARAEEAERRDQQSVDVP